MSSISFRSTSRKAFIYISVFLVVVGINVYTNRKYILNGLSHSMGLSVGSAPKQVATNETPRFYKREVLVRSGYSIDSLLLKQDIAEGDVVYSSRALAKVFDPRDLKAGTAVTIFYDWENRSQFMGYEFSRDYATSVVVERDDTGSFAAEIADKIFTTKINRVQSVIESSLYVSAISEGVTPNIIMNLIQLYSFDVDFQRDIQDGTGFEIIYEDYVNEFGEVIEHGDILAAQLTFKDRKVPIYRYTTLDGKTDYFNPQGKSARKSLLKTPINGAYISSNFGMRRHPISGYTAFHRGTDFAARSGTPIFASGDGVITSAIVSNKGYGIHIKIRHPNGYETLYAHMRSHARGMKKGVRVNQGQVIGYVGSTGNSTGPHLHYETRYNGKFVNPSSIKIPPGRTLKGKDLELFKESIKGYSLNP